MKNNILICGVGGQGTVLASRLIAFAAMADGSFVRTAETIGMAQRGGSVVSHVRINSEEESSIIPLKTAELLISFEPAEAARCLPRLCDDGYAVVNTRTVMPVTASLGGVAYDSEAIIRKLRSEIPHLVMLDAAELAKQAGSDRAVNTVLIGAAIGAGFLELSESEAEAALKALIKPKLFEMNLNAFRLGVSAGRNAV